MGDVIAVKEKSKSSTRYKEIGTESTLLPKWLEKSENDLSGKVIAMPEREDIDFPVEEHLFVELYSK